MAVHYTFLNLVQALSEDTDTRLLTALVQRHWYKTTYCACRKTLIQDCSLRLWKDTDTRLLTALVKKKLMQVCLLHLSTHIDTRLLTALVQTHWHKTTELVQTQEYKTTYCTSPNTLIQDYLLHLSKVTNTRLLTALVQTHWYKTTYCTCPKSLTPDYLLHLYKQTHWYQTTYCTCPNTLISDYLLHLSKHTDTRLLTALLQNVTDCTSPAEVLPASAAVSVYIHPWNSRKSCCQGAMYRDCSAFLRSVMKHLGRRRWRGECWYENNKNNVDVEESNNTETASFTVWTEKC